MKSRHLIFPGCVVFVCLWTSCGRSSVSSAVASSYEPEPVRAIEVVEEGLKVRPDVLRVSFAFRQESESLEQAVPKLKAAVDRYVRAAAEASKVEVAVKMKDVGLDSGGKRMAGSGSDGMAHGVLEVALPEAQDFWARTALVATLVKVGSQEEAAAEKANTGLRASFGFPVAQVRDPEARRDELMKRWVERARGFIAQAQSERAPLQLVACEPPGAVKQEPESVDEVVLSLAVSCRLDVVAK